MAEYPSSTQDKYIIRMPDGLRDRIREKADANRRSMNAEIVALLEEHYPPQTPETVQEPAARILLWLARRIRRQDPKPGSARDRRAQLYETVASDIVTRADAIDRSAKER
ncbi:Arc family DNA-binding protein [Rhodobacteraceae bacterium 63075]|nr:Arc family DNA-binding protein [Rhodobacteraceae bacterium 63075]